MSIKLKYLIPILVLFLFSCNGENNNGYVVNRNKTVSEDEVKAKMLEKANRYLVIRENEDIENYVNRHKWNVTKTGTGLRYEIYEKGSGRKVKKGDIVSLDYKMYLITGDMIYSSDSLGPKVFQVGRGGVETGLEEMVLYLHKGDKAHVVLPSHLAYGLKGDLNKIPRKAIIIYDLQLIDIK